LAWSFPEPGLAFNLSSAFFASSDSGPVILLLEIEVTDFDILQGSMRIVGTKFLDVSRSVFSRIGFRHRAIGMIFGIVRGWA
jgi:hypothetical protein